VGRADELAALDSFLKAARSQFAVLAIEGEPGIGKTTIWREGVRLAREQGATVLVARATESETGLSFTGLADLFDPLGDRLLEGLPTPQKEALRAALLKVSAPDRGVDVRALSASVLSLLRTLSGERHVVVAVDDAPWLDSASARALAFAARRLEAEAVGFLVTVRAVGNPLPSFDRAADPNKRTRLPLGPLSLAVLHELIKRHVGHGFPRPVMVRIAEASGGNPFYALEIAAELSRRPPLQGRLAVPPSLSELLEARIGGLPERTRDALLVAAMLSRPTPELIDVEALEPAERAGIVRIERGRIRFSHPLLAAAVYDRIGTSQRQRAHRELAEMVNDPEEKARHLALGTTKPDERVAAALDAAAVLAARRGAPQAAAELIELAIELTRHGSGGGLVERQLAAGHYWFDAGDLERAQRLLAEALAHAPPGDLRCRVLALMGQLHYRRSSFSEAIQVARRARQEATDPDLQVRLELDLSFFSVSLADFANCERHARTAVQAVAPDGHPGLVAQVLAVVTMAEFLCGGGLDERRLERALELEDPAMATAWQMRPSFIAGCLCLYSGRPEKAVAILSVLHSYAVEHGEESFIPIHCLYLTWALIWHGELERAREVAEIATQTASLLGDPAAEGAALTAAALVHAHDGSTLLARDEACQAIRIFQELNWPTGVIFPTWALGLAQTAAGDPEAVDSTLGPLADMLITIADVDPAMAMFLPEEIEALIQLGRLDPAEALLGWLEKRATKLDRSLALAVAGRCRALLHAERGDHASALEAVEQAVGEHDRIDMPFERARTLLIWGRLLRRAGRRGQAKEVLADALGVFERIGTPPWAEQARADLDRLGGRRATSDQLTPTESLIAGLAASGISNQEIAGRAFLTVKAVEANLTRIYRKLGIRSRGGLARALREVGENTHR
jgi:DNA-binding CsgD family transcriptional regulator